MSETLLSSRNLAFELYEVLDAEGLTQRERFAEHNRETFDAALGTARSIAEKFFAPHNRKGCLLYTSPSPRDRQKSRMPSSA